MANFAPIMINTLVVLAYYILNKMRNSGGTPAIPPRTDGVSAPHERDDNSKGKTDTATEEKQGDSESSQDVKSLDSQVKSTMSEDREQKPENGEASLTDDTPDSKTHGSKDRIDTVSNKKEREPSVAVLEATSVVEDSVSTLEVKSENSSDVKSGASDVKSATSEEKGREGYASPDELLITPAPDELVVPKPVNVYHFGSNTSANAFHFSYKSSAELPVAKPEEKMEDKREVKQQQERRDIMTPVTTECRETVVVEEVPTKRQIKKVLPRRNARALDGLKPRSMDLSELTKNVSESLSPESKTNVVQSSSKPTSTAAAQSDTEPALANELPVGNKKLKPHADMTATTRNPGDQEDEVEEDPGTRKVASKDVLKKRHILKARRLVRTPKEVAATAVTGNGGMAEPANESMLKTRHIIKAKRGNTAKVDGSLEAFNLAYKSWADAVDQERKTNVSGCGGRLVAEPLAKAEEPQGSKPEKAEEKREVEQHQDIKPAAADSDPKPSGLKKKKKKKKKKNWF